MTGFLCIFHWFWEHFGTPIQNVKMTSKPEIATCDFWMVNHLEHFFFQILEGENALKHTISFHQQGFLHLPKIYARLIATLQICDNIRKRAEFLIVTEIGFTNTLLFELQYVFSNVKTREFQSHTNITVLTHLHSRPGWLSEDHANTVSTTV